jgi:hypothetical protein
MAGFFNQACFFGHGLCVGFLSKFSREKKHCINIYTFHSTTPVILKCLCVLVHSTNYLIMVFLSYVLDSNISLSWVVAADKTGEAAEVAAEEPEVATHQV